MAYKVHANPLPFGTTRDLHLTTRRRGQFARLFGRVQNVSTSDLTFVHQIIYLLQFTESDDLDGCLDKSAAEKVERLCRVTPVTDIAV